MRMRDVALLLVILFGFISSARPLFLFDFPLSWDVWYHIAITQNFSSGNFFWDNSFFAPEGRSHTYPPLFHILLSLLSRIGGFSPLMMARILPPILFSSSLLTFFLLSRRLLGDKSALAATLFSSVTPIILDKGLAPLPETLSFPFLFAGLMYFYERKMRSVLFFLLAFLTHGLTFIVCVATVVLFSFLMFCSEKDTSRLMFSIKVCIVLLVVTSPYFLYTYFSKTTLPYGGRHLLSFYPTKLGWVSLVLTCLSLPFLRRSGEHILIVSFLAATFLLSFNPFLLPARFIEYMAWPAAMLSGIAANEILSKEKGRGAIILCIIFLFGFFQSHTYTEKFKPEVDHTEYLSLLFLAHTSLSGNVMSDWHEAPLIAAISGRPVFWGGYELTAPRLHERKEDYTLMETTWDASLLKKYGIRYFFFEGKEKEIPLDKIYCSSHSLFIVPPKA
jgi:hypothetical protein